MHAPRRTASRAVLFLAAGSAAAAVVASAVADEPTSRDAPVRAAGVLDVRFAGRALAEAGPPGPARAPALPRLDAAAREGLVYVGADGERITPARVERFLLREGSPLAPYAETIVEAGIDAGVDPRLVVAIAGIESDFGRRQIGHNAWGWGIHGGQVRRFADWSTAIVTFTRELAANYDTASFDTAFAQRYVPSNWQRWYAAVTTFLARI